MGKKLDRLLGRTFKTSKFKTLVNLAISRLSILKNHRQVRCSQARSDVLQLLNLAHQERALLRVEQVIKEQNMLDVFVMVEGYCHLLIQRADLIEKSKECPDELKEAISSLQFAASRCGQFPELQEIHGIFTSLFGKEFAARAVELHNDCGVNLMMIQKLSTRQPSLESRLKVLKEIASESGIVLHLNEESSKITDMKQELNQKQNQSDANLSANSDNDKYRDDTITFPEEIDIEKQFSGSVKVKYRDFTDAAQAAFESAAYAAAAARVAVELSRSRSGDNDPGDRHRYLKFTPGIVEKVASASRDAENSTGRLSSEKIHPHHKYSSGSEDEQLVQKYDESHLEEFKKRMKKPESERSPSTSSFDSARDALKDNKMFLNRPSRAGSLGKEIVFHERDDVETGNEQDRIPWSRQRHSGPDKKSRLKMDELLKLGHFNAAMDEHQEHQFLSAEQVHIQRSNIERKPVSVRTRQAHKQ